MCTPNSLTSCETLKARGELLLVVDLQTFSHFAHPLCSIDTNTVVNRVNELFDGHTDLIQAFNQFLPVNQRASPLPSMSAGQISQQTVVSSLPQPASLPGSIMQGGLMSLSLASADVSGGRNIVQNPSVFGPGAPSRLAGSGPAQGLLRSGNLSNIVNVASAGPNSGANVPSTGGGAAAGGAGGGEVGQRNQPEFSQAITYVNKIKVSRGCVRFGIVLEVIVGDCRVSSDLLLVLYTSFSSD